MDTVMRVGPMSSADSPMNSSWLTAGKRWKPAGQEALWLEKRVMVGLGEVGELFPSLSEPKGLEVEVSE